MGVCTHDSAALKITTGALAGCTSERARVGNGRVARERAGLTVRRCRVWWTNGRVARADFLRVTRAGRRPTDLARRRKLAVVAAIFIGIVADGVILELACRRIAAGVAAAALGATTVAVFAVFDDTIATLVAGDSDDAFVRGQTCRVDGVAAEGRADVADAAGGEMGDAVGGEGIHDVLFPGIAGLSVERAALLRIDGVGIRAGLRRTVVDGAESVAGLVGDDLPLGGGLGDDVGARRGFIASALGTGRADCFAHACLS